MTTENQTEVQVAALDVKDGTRIKIVDSEVSIPPAVMAEVLDFEKKAGIRLKSSDFKEGMRVKVRDSELSRFLKGFANKIQGREAIVIWVSKYDNHEDAKADPTYVKRINRIQVEFQKRNGRGTPFREMMEPGYFEILEN